jgi:hypothetical protein
MNLLDNLPLASLLTVAAIVGGVIALIQGEVSFEEFLISLGAFTGGAGLLGVARAQSGKGVRR